MQVLVNPHRMTVEGSDRDIQKILQYLKDSFGEVHVSIDMLNVRDTLFWQETEAEDTPGFRVLGLRTKSQLTQQTLGEKIGKSKQFISDLENDRRAVSKDVAKSLGGVFDVDYRTFL